VVTRKRKRGQELSPRSWGSLTKKKKKRKETHGRGGGLAVPVTFPIGRMMINTGKTRYFYFAKLFPVRTNNMPKGGKSNHMTF